MYPTSSCTQSEGSEAIFVIISFDVLRDRNVYTFKVVNMDDGLLHRRVSASSIGSLRLDAQGADPLLDMQRTAHDVWRAAHLPGTGSHLIRAGWQAGRGARKSADGPRR